MAQVEGVRAHLAGGLTTLCRCWTLTLRDGTVMGFTDHDGDLLLDGVPHRAESGLSAAALQQSSGLAVDNSEAAGALSADWIGEADIASGRFDGAGVLARLVNWAAPAETMVLFRGTLGEVTRGGGAFRAELRGLAEALNRPQGTVIHAPCPAVLGDGRCGVDLSAAGLSVETEVLDLVPGGGLRVAAVQGAASGWFERGRLWVVSGQADGARGLIKRDRGGNGAREVALWEPLVRWPEPGDAVRLEAGCDKRAATCRAKFGNIANFRGFPHVPGEDWLMAVPANQAVTDGGSRRWLR